MKRLRTRPAPHKTNRLPVGLSCTWLKRPGKRPYFEIQAYLGDQVRHFYVGVEPTVIRLRFALLRALACRRAYELQCGVVA